ncbi:hypothetical protein PCIT_a1172 [Pseudoalteromonas citrea]|uniref:Uncharacterized protein n=1 Tax=Pseudoalteromonas citrea TaxID=43655 RepID=A0AAD4ALX4_9GAMM|nr:bacteriocin [Pseudoalteromonas citrea]KAF7775073.1 hypothetical protein PCIT_a1172 [Pseudoalteromonas citrea]
MKVLDKHQLKQVYGGDSRSPDLPARQQALPSPPLPIYSIGG